MLQEKCWMTFSNIKKTSSHYVRIHVMTGVDFGDWILVFFVTQKRELPPFFVVAKRVEFLSLGPYF